MVKWERANRTKLQTYTADVNDFIKLLVYIVDTLQHTPSSKRAKLSISNRGKKKQQRQNISHSWTLLKIIIMWCRIKSRDITGTKTSAPCIPWLYISRMVYFITCHCASFLMIWSMKLVLFMSCKKLSSFYIMEKMPQIKNVDNFSDGCAGQCKHNTFLNQHRHFLQQARVNISVMKLVSLC